MPFRSAIWIDKLDKLEIDGDGVRISLNSDDFIIKLRMSEAQLMRFVETARMALLECRETEGGSVVVMGRRKP